MSRRVAIIQSNYIPWRGYFDLIDDADIFVIYDAVQYTKNDWRNRNKIKTPVGPRWLTVPVRHEFLGQSIDAVKVATDRPWRRIHADTIKVNYAKAKFFEPVFSAYIASLESAPDTLSGLNRALIRWVMETLTIQTNVVDVRTLAASGQRTERLIAITRELGGEIYLSGPSASAYLDIEAFRNSGIGLQYKSYTYEPYQQCWGPFIGEVSILDLLFNTGPEARKYLKSSVSNVLVV